MSGPSAPFNGVTGTSTYGGPWPGGAAGQINRAGNPLGVSANLGGGQIGAPGNPSQGNVGGQAPSCNYRPNRGANTIIPYVRFVSGARGQRDVVTGQPTAAAERLEHLVDGELAWIGRGPPSVLDGTVRMGPEKIDVMASTEYVQQFFAGPRAGPAGTLGQLGANSGWGPANPPPRDSKEASEPSHRWVYDLGALGALPPDHKPPDNTEDDRLHMLDPRRNGTGTSDVQAPARTVHEGTRRSYSDAPVAATDKSGRAAFMSGSDSAVVKHTKVTHLDVMKMFEDVPDDERVKGAAGPAVEHRPTSYVDGDATQEQNFKLRSGHVFNKYENIAGVNRSKFEFVRLYPEVRNSLETADKITGVGPNAYAFRHVYGNVAVAYVGLGDRAGFSGGGLRFDADKAFACATPLRNCECVSDFDPLETAQHALTDGVAKVLQSSPADTLGKMMEASPAD